MEIKYLGHSSFQIKNKNASVITDPYDSLTVGLKFPKLEADIVTVSHDHKDHNQYAQVGGSPLIINIPGEYEKNEIRISGFKTYHDKKDGVEKGLNIMFKIEVDDIAILHCGDLAHKLSDELLEEIDNVDILMLPVGGVNSLNAQEASELVKQIEPEIIIPMHYDHIAINKTVFPDLAPVSEFISKMGLSELAPVNKLTLKKEEIHQETARVVLMEVE
jgi:L-ascorbate metabolism protein UlaG (beta-lactamase superfamily)